MVDLILNGIVQYKPVRFLQPPKDTYAVFFDDVVFRGADDLIGIEEHSLRIEVYASVIDKNIESNIEQKLIELSLEFDKGERIWLNEVERYMTPYYIDYTKKRSN